MIHSGVFPRVENMSLRKLEEPVCLRIISRINHLYIDCTRYSSVIVHLGLIEEMKSVIKIYILRISAETHIFKNHLLNIQGEKNGKQVLR